MLNVAITHPLFLISRYDNGVEEEFRGLLDLKKPQLIKNGSIWARLTSISGLLCLSTF